MTRLTLASGLLLVFALSALTVALAGEHPGAAGCCLTSAWFAASVVSALSREPKRN